MSFGVKSRREREQEQRRRMARGRRNLSQLAGPQAQGGRKPMQQGYTTTSVKPPPFQQSNVGNDIMQAGLAFKGGKGVHDFATGTEGGYNKAGVWVEGKEPWSLGGKSISDRISQYGTDVSDQFSNAPKDFNNLLNPQPSPADLGYQSVNAPARGLFEQSPSMADIDAAKSGVGGQNMLFKTAPMPQSANLMGDAGSAFAGSNALSTQMAPPNLASSFGKALNSVGAGSGLGATAGSSSLFSGGASGMQGLGHLGSFSGGEGIQGLGHLSGGSAGGLQGGSAGIGFGGGSTPFGTAGAKGIEAGTSTATSGLQGGGGGTPWMAYANIGKDLIMGGPGSEKITGSTAGDAAIRAAAAYFTFGLSEIPYALF